MWTLRQPRYAALAALMLVLAVGCVAAGTWQISRFEQSVHANDVLKANAHAPAVPLTTALVPLVDHGPAPRPDAFRFRTVAATGTYVSGVQEFLRDQSLNGSSGYDVLEQLRTANGTLLVVRGFVAAHVSGNGTNTPPSGVPAPLSGLVHVVGWLESTGTSDDGATELSNGEIASINPAEQAARRNAAVFDTYLTLNADQPGTSGVSVLPGPDLSNPAGGAYEGQHFAYIIQWYLFALLALAAPFAIGRHEVRDAQRRFLGIDPANEQFDIPVSIEAPRRLQLTDRMHRAVDGAPAHDVAIARAAPPTTEQWQRAANLADRYGRSLGLAHPEPARQEGRSAHPDNAAAVEEGDRAPTRIPSSAITPARSLDDRYHGTYNDYLWQLALADGAVPSVSPARIEETHAPGPPDPDIIDGAELRDQPSI
jgi:cytochrome oxidase assembly protein ShyY1